MVSSLKNLCRIPGLVEILHHPHMKKEIFSLPINEYNYEERDDALQRAVSELLKDYNLVIKENIQRHFIIFIGFEMTKWAEYLKEYFGLSFNFSKNFIKSSFFTSKGFLDEEKAAKELLKEQSFSLFLKYKIACQYFLEDIIPSLWQELRNSEPNFKEWLKEHNPECPMVMWSDYLEEINSSSELIQKVKTRHFKVRVFSYGLKNKNLAAIMFSYGPKRESRKTTEEVKIVRKLVDTTFCNFIRQTLKHIEFYETSTNSLLSREFVTDCNIIKYFLSLMSIEELKEFFLKFDDSVNIVSKFLLWPYQYQFMDFVPIILIFENFGVVEYNKLMSDIISLISDKYMSQFYNYRLLLREVWIKSPAHLKEQIIETESEEIIGDRISLITMLFTQPKFTAHDLNNVNLILKYANLESRSSILMNHGIRICDHLVVSHRNFKLADLFVKTFDLDKNILQRFKNFFVIKDFHNMMKKQNINLIEDIFKWVVGSDEIDDFKDAIFNRFSVCNKADYFFQELEEEVPFCFLNKILKWFLKTDENVKEWINNIEYYPTTAYKYPKWVDRLLKYRGYSDEEASGIKKDKIFEELPQISWQLRLKSHEIEYALRSNILVLSLLKKEQLVEFTDRLRSFYEVSMRQKKCLWCLFHNFNLPNRRPSFCDAHATLGFMPIDKINQICSFVNQIDYLFQIYECRLKSRQII